ncbi:MAG: hypothetical protein K2X12_02880 [Burkholderiaceae bacterium]|nr:hypothetical protein [Burkholderiaceae bacterium]
MSTEKKGLSDRAKHRLRLAAGLLRSEGVSFECPRDQFYDKVQEVLAGLPADKQAHLRELVDWVEDYDRAERVGQVPTSARGS